MVVENSDDLVRIDQKIKFNVNIKKNCYCKP